jgi:hypothetical protein
VVLGSVFRVVGKLRWGLGGCSMPVDEATT